MATSNRIRVSVIEGYYVSLQEAGLPLSVCIQLQECKLSLRHAQWTARQTSSGFSVSLFWPEQLDAQKGVIPSAKKRRKRCKRKMDKTVLPQCPCSTAGVSQPPCPEADAPALTTIPNGAHSATTEPTHCTRETGGSSKASTADLTLSVSSDHDDGLPELLTYDSVVYELKSDQPGVKVSKDGNEEWIPVAKKRRKRTYKRKEDESEPVSASDDSGDELKVKFAREVRYKVKDGTPGLKIRRGNTMQSWKWTPIAPSPIANRTRSRIS